MPHLFALLILSLSLQANLVDSQSWERSRSVAESQHEIVMLLIRGKAFDKVLRASQEIFSLRFPYNQEHLFVTEGQILSGALYDHQQYELAQALLDQALRAVNSNNSKALLYKEKAYLCKQEGKTDEAMELFEKAVELEKSAP
ncbi:MAG: tetratricopeptide repeat protein [Acidobacteria bacterium]|nr:MAG: tetratricopeptide repeat protein [Acidobacteriota bacterium]